MKAASKSTRAGRGFPRHPLYVCLFAAFAVLASDFPVQAQQAPTVSGAPQQYSIAAGELGDALNQLAIQSQVHIVYAPDLVKGRLAPAINGRMTWHQALGELLAGSGLEWSLVGPNLVAIRKVAAPAQKAQRQPVEPKVVPPPAPVATTLKGMTVLGSLIPRSRVETASPLIVITADDIKSRGFSSVADALQNATVSTGSINNTAINAGDIWAAKTISLFGLDPSYTKFLIDGRPMPLFSQMSQSTTVDQLYTNLDGIPIDMVDRIEILPGGQSSLYGSDAVAGVVNIVLKKHVNAASVDARVGWYSDGGGRERMVSANDEFNIGKLSVLAGIQVNDQQPMWALQRGITAQNFAGGLNPQQPSTVAGVSGFSGVTYYPSSPADCSKLAALWGGSVTYVSNAYGAYCGTNRSGGYSTLMTKSQQASVNLHATYTVNDQLKLYGDLLDSYEKQSHEVANGFFSVLYDPNLQDDVFVERFFAPEEISTSLNGLLSQTDYENTYTATVGAKYDFGNDWNLDVGFTRGVERIDDRQIGMLATSIPGSYGATVLGPRLGTDSFGYPIYTPNYSLLENPLTPAQFASYLGAASIASSDRTDRRRAALSATRCGQRRCARQAPIHPLAGKGAGRAESSPRSREGVQRGTADSGKAVPRRNQDGNGVLETIRSRVLNTAPLFGTDEPNPAHGMYGSASHPSFSFRSPSKGFAMKQHGKFTTLSLGILLSLGLAAGGFCPAHAAGAPAATTAQGNGVTRATLDNGLRVVIVRDTLAPMVTTQITYMAGSYEAPDGFPGTAHALEHMMFRDSKGMAGAQLDEMVGKMGAEDNAFTTNDATQYYFVAPAQYLDVLLHIEATRMRGAQLTDKDWDLEKGAIEQEVSRDISDPGQLALEEAERTLYAGTGYAEDALGTRPSFDKTTGATLQKFYDEWYAPNNAVLVIVGDVDPAATLGKVKQLFEPIPKGNVPERAPMKLAPFRPVTIAKTAPDATGTVQYMFRMPGQQSKDYAAMDVLLDVLSNSRSSLSELAAQGKVLSAGAQAQPFANGGMGLVQVSFPKGGDSKAAQGHLDGVINDLLKNGVSADLVEAAKLQEHAQYAFSRNSATDLASSWSQALAWQGLDSPEEAQAQIQAVTVDDVNRVAREYLKPDQRVTVVLTPNADGKRPPNSSGFGGTESFTSNAKLDAPLPEWAAQALGKLEMPRWTLDPVRMTLANGITLIVQPETISKTVTVVGHVDQNDDLQEPKGQEGVGQLLGSLFDYGSTTLDRNAFHKALDEIAATESAGPDFKLAVPAENFDQGMQLLADNELHPALSTSGFAVQQQTLSHTLAGELQSPRYKMGRALKNGLLPAGDPGLREATPATVDKLTLADATAYYGQTYRPDMTTIVVVGNVTPDQARAEVEKTFGAWKASGPKPDVIPKAVPINPASYSVVPNAYASQDTVVMGQSMALDLHNPDRYALQLGNYVLGGNGFASRLMMDMPSKANAKR